MAFDRMYKPIDMAPAWLTLIPTEPTEQELLCYPRERVARVMHDTQVGTVDELTELFRRQLTACFKTMTSEGGVIPMLGEASLRKQTECLQRNNLDLPGYSVPLKASGDEIAAFEARFERYGPKPRQSLDVRARLKQFVTVHAMYDTNDEFAHLHGPTDDPAYVQRLINALFVLKEDAEARYNHGKTLADAREAKEVPPPGTDAAD